MTDPEWPQELVDALNDLGVENPTVCGEHKPDAKVRALGGCLKPLEDPTDRYKCADCKVTFHRACIREHFHTSGDRCEELRDRMVNLIRVIRRAADRFDVKAVLDALEQMATR